MTLHTVVAAPSSATEEGQHAPATARGRATRQRLLDAAVTEFGERGFHTASVSAITSRAGIGQGTFYIYFSSKEACYAQVVDTASRALRRALVRGFSQLVLADCLYESFRGYLAFAVEHPAALHAISESAFIDQTAWQTHQMRLLHCYADLLERHAGTATPHEDRELHALAISGSLQAVTSDLVQQVRDGVDDIDQLLDGQARVLAELFLYGSGERG